MIRRILFSALFLLVVFGLNAFQFQPITMDFEESGSEAIQSFQATNDTDAIVALSISMFRREISPDGKDILKNAENDFVIFPERMVLQPGQDQMIRVQYRGRSVYGEERAYRIIAEQVPVNFNPESDATGLNILFRYIGSVYILPDNIVIGAEISRFSQVSKPEGEFLEFWVSSTGTSHTILQNLSITLSSGSLTLNLEQEDLVGLANENLLAGGQRRFLVPWPDGFTLINIEGQISFRELR